MTRRRPVPALLLLLLAVTHCWFFNQYTRFVNPNILAHVYPALAAVDDGTLHMDGPSARYAPIQDRAVHGGHVYSDKAPGQAALLTPIAWVLRKAGIPIGNLRPMIVGLRLLGLSLPLVCFWWWVLGYVRQWTDDDERAAGVVVSGAVGSAFFFYATQLFSHALVGALLFAAWILFRRAKASDEGDGVAAAASGAVAGLAFTVDFIVMLGVVALFVLMIFQRRRQLRLGVLFGVGCAVPLLLWMGYNNACFDHPLKVAYHFHAQANWRTSYTGGVFGIQRPQLGAALGLLFSSHRGLLFLSPALLLAFPGWVRGLRDDDLRFDALSSVVVFGAVFLFATTTVDWEGGWSAGPRYIVGTVPFLLVGVSMAVRRSGAGREGAPLAFAALSGIAIVSVAIAATSFPAFPRNWRNPVFNLGWSLITDGTVTLSLLVPWGLQAAAVPLYALVTLGSVAYVAVRMAGPAQAAPARAVGRRVLYLAVTAGVTVLLVALVSRIPEAEDTAGERAAMRAAIVRLMGYDR